MGDATTQPAVSVTVVGCGDAFGSGGRLMSGYLVDTPDGAVLIDCGASISIGLNRLQRAADDIGTVIISHLHGDHFAGLIWLLMQALYVTKRTAPLAVYGPAGTEARFHVAAEALFPGCTAVPRRFRLSFHALAAGVPMMAGPVTVTAFEVEHPSGAASYALRLEIGRQVLAFTGDTQWTDALVACGRAADLYIMECYRFADTTAYHLTWQTIAQNLDRIGAKRVLLTHMSDDMLGRRGEVHDARVLLAEDGLRLNL